MSPAKAAMKPKELRALLTKAGKSQRELADMLGVEKGTVNRWVTGKFAINKFVADAIRAKLSA